MTGRMALTVKPRFGEGIWEWAAAGESVARQGSVTASNREDAVLQALVSLHGSRASRTELTVLVSLPPTARLWDHTGDIAAAFPGLLVERCTEGEQRLLTKAMRSLDAPVELRPRTLSPLVVATDGSAHRGNMGWGWLAEDGQHDLGSQTPARTTCRPTTMPVLAELRAICAAIQALSDRRLVIRTDCQRAIRLVADWSAGRDKVPAGYQANAQTSAAKGGVDWMQQVVRANAHRVQLEWVRGHAGDPLNEGADSLAKLARRRLEPLWAITPDEVPARAASIAATFAAAGCGVAA